MKKITSLLLALTLCLGLLTLPAAAASEDTAARMQHTAEALKYLTLFRGSDKGFELDRAPTRMEAVIMLVRLLGKENEALAGEWSHPFTDAPTWQNAAEYLGYAYASGLTRGTSATTFSPNEPASARECVTLTLRALGYADSQEGSLWDRWETQANGIGLIPAEMTTGSGFTRGDAVLLYYNALSCQLCGSAMNLTDSLVEAGVFGSEAPAVASLLANDQVDLADSSLEVILAALYARLPSDLSRMRTMTMEINADNAAYYLGVDTLDFEEAMASEPMMLAQAHSVCLVRMKDGSDIQAAMDAMRAGVDPQKWICVGVDPENVRTAAVGNLILLVLDNRHSQEFIDTFLAMGA
ncbi:MAG: DUF4358 domain-containing protein [Butyricicoccaceae bacterium]